MAAHNVEGGNASGVWSEGNTTLGRTGHDSSLGWSGGDSTLDETMLHPVIGTIEFPPLSQRPIAPDQTMPADNPADHIVLRKQTPIPPGEEEFKVEKNLDDLIPESEKMMISQLHLAKHTHAISTELKLLLENEQKILKQVIKRCEKFTKLKEENKHSTEEWNQESKKRLPHFENHLVKLANYPDDQIMDADEAVARVQQKVLLEIVSKTILVVNNMSVQLSMENTIINDIESSLLDLKHQTSAMLRQVASWLKILMTLDQNQGAVVERWRQLKQRLKDLREKAKKEMDESLGGVSETKVMSMVRGYEDRIRVLEEACRRLAEGYRAACDASRDPPCGQPAEGYSGGCASSYDQHCRQPAEGYSGGCASSYDQPCRQPADVCNSPCASPCDPQVQIPYS